MTHARTACRSSWWMSCSVARFCRVLAGVLLALLALVAVVLVARRLSGALQNPLGPLPLFSLAIVLALWAGAVRELYAIGTTGSAPRRFAFAAAAAGHFAWLLLPSLWLLLAGAALSLPGTSGLALLAFWSILVVAEVVSLRRHLGSFAQPESAETSVEMAVADVAESLPDEPDAKAPGEDISQQIVRRRQADGSERLEGWTRADFTAGQRNASVHVAFCPPLAAKPECYVEQADGPAAEVKLAQLFAYGARFDVKLDRAAIAPSSVLLEFAAVGPAVQGSRD